MKLDKDEVRRPDAFLKLSHSVSRWIESNRKVIAILVVGGLLGVAGYTGYQIYSDKKETQAQESLYQARKKFNPALVNPVPPKEAPVPKLSEDSVQAYESVIQKFWGTQASKVAAIELSQAYLDENKPDNAMKVYESTKDVRPKDILSSLFVLQKAKVLEANGKCPEAVGILEKIWTSTVMKVIQTEARLRAGICYEQMSQPEKAKEMFKTASQEKGGAADTARKYLRLMEPNAG